MPKLDRYLFREFAQSFAATLIVLLTVSLGGVLTDLLGRIAEAKESYEASLRLDPADEDVRQSLDKLIRARQP